MNEMAMNAEMRGNDYLTHSFVMTSYYMLHNRLPWEMDAIEFLWNENMEEARGITLELQKIDLKARNVIYKIAKLFLK